MKAILLPAALLLAAAPAQAAEISTHVLDLARGIGGAGVPVVLSRHAGDGSWKTLATATTDRDGRVRSFGDPKALGPGTYRITFDMARYPDANAKPFFPEIVLTFRVDDAAAHYHVPVAVSPFGYSTYRGN